jgi:shikimate dehydrogenase
MERPGNLVGVVGFPVGHSRSPAMHNAAFGELGIHWRYLKLPVPPERFSETLLALPGSGYRGVNVTVPHKIAALGLAAEASEAARAIGAANTLTFEGDSVVADNTDAAGFLDALETAPEGRRALVLGAGGAGRAVAWALRQGGAAEVCVWNRTFERAVALADDLGVKAVRGFYACDLLVNATTVGLDPDVWREDALRELGLAAVSPPETVVDLVYGDHVTPVCSWASEAGSRVIDGVEVLVRQGARSLERWTGRTAPLDVMRAAARA